jgi:hypothetical protein
MYAATSLSCLYVIIALQMLTQVLLYPVEWGPDETMRREIGSSKSASEVYGVEYLLRMLCKYSSMCVYAYVRMSVCPFVSVYAAARMCFSLFFLRV